MSRLICAFLFSISLLNAQGGPPGALIADLEVAPADPSVVIAASNRGVFFSSTSGQTWSALREGLPTLDIPGAAGNRSVVYAAARDSGVYRSRSGGPFEAANNGLQNLNIVSVACDPSNAEIVYAGTASGQIFKSLNGGESWTSASQGLPDGSYFEIRISPVDSNWLFASNLSADGTTGRLVRSTNGGGQWATVLSGNVGIESVAFARSEHGTVWVATSAGLRRSTNFGGGFETAVLGSTQFLSVAIDPENAQAVYAGTALSGLVQTTDGGANWNVTGSGLPRSPILRVEATTQSIFAGLNGTGVYRSDNGGGSWQLSSTGMRAATVRALAVNPDDGQDVLASTTGGGLFRTQDGGSSWGESRTGMNVFEVRSLQHDHQFQNIVYAGAVNPYQNGDGALLQSTDGGQSWTALLTQTPILAIATHPSDGSTAYFGGLSDGFSTPGLFRRTNSNSSFQYVSGNAGELIGFDVTAIDIDPNNGDRIFVIARDRFRSASVTYYVVWSTDAGVTWSGGLASTTPWTRIVVDPSDSNRLFVGSLSGIARTTDGGANFKLLTAGLPNSGAVAVSSIAIDRNDGAAIYIATDSGIYKSSDGGDNWAAANSGFGDLVVAELRVHPAQAGTLYAATVGGGVFQTTDGGANWLPTGRMPTLLPSGVVNAATFKATAIAPGEIVSLFVQNGGPEEGVVATGFEPGTGKLGTTLAGVRVLFNGIPGALFFVRSDQLNVQAPFEIAGLQSVDVQVEFEGVLSSPMSVPVRTADPGLFSPVLNQDNTLNTQQNPAARGSVVQLFATGQGSVTPALMSGLPGPGAPPFPAPEAAVRALVNGEEAMLLFKGLTPGLVGLMQLNVMLPGDVSGQVTIELFIGDVASPTKTTVYVQ
jgi:uncharacterized protein (TIGR03437 family)